MGSSTKAWCGYSIVNSPHPAPVSDRRFFGENRLAYIYNAIKKGDFFFGGWGFGRSSDVSAHVARCLPVATHDSQFDSEASNHKSNPTPPNHPTTGLEISVIVEVEIL